MKIGAPDYAITRMTNHGPLTVGYIETKDIGASLDETEKSEQMGRYLRGLNNLVLTDYPLTQKAKGCARSHLPSVCV